MHERKEYPFSEKTEWILRNAGWYPGRSISLDAFEHRLDAEHVSILPTVKAFLEEFHGLTIEGLKFDAEDLFLMKHGKTRRGLEQLVDSPLQNIGIDIHFGSRLLMDNSGAVYRIDYPSFERWGESGYEALQNLLEVPAKRYRRLAPYHDDLLERILTEAKTVVIIGYDDPFDAELAIPIGKYLESVGYKVYHISQRHNEINDATCYTQLTDIPEPIDIISLSAYPPRDQTEWESQLRNLIDKSSRLNIRTIWFSHAVDIGALQAYAREKDVLIVVAIADDDGNIVDSHQRLLGNST